MTTPTPSQVLDEVLAAARARIRDDARPFADDPALLALFEILERRIFDAALDVNGLLAAGDVSRETHNRFVARFGSLKRYLDERRVEAAARLLRGTDWRIGEVGRRVGYEVPRTFQRTCQRVAGRSPSELRREALPESADEPVDLESDEPEVADSELPLPALAARWRRRVTLGLGDADHPAELRRLLRERYPGLRRGRQTVPAWVERPVHLLKTDDELETVATVAVLNKVLNMDDAAQHHALIHGLRFRIEGNVFHALREIALKLLRADRARALRLAERTVELVEAHTAGRADAADWRALAWTALADLRLRVRDLAGADQAFAFARAEWTTPGSRHDPQVEAEICRHEAGLRRLQRRYDEAARCFDRALEISAGTSHEAFHLICRLERAELALLLGDHRTSTEMLKGVSSRKGPPAGLPELGCRLAAMDARAAVLAGQHAKAAKCFRRARGLLDAPNFHAAESLREEARFLHRSGRLERAEALYREARDQYAAVGASVFAAAARAELAALRTGDGQAAEVAELAAFFESLPLHREARIVARILRSLDAPANDDALAELRRCLDLVVWEVPNPSLVAGKEDAP